jgi:ketosteroid isomerase-like protein
MPAAARILTLAFALVALAGCGDDHEADVRAAVEDYVAALRAGDTERVCSLLTEAELADLDVSTSCKEVFSDGFALLDEQGVEIPDYEIADVTVDGDRAEATLVSGSIDTAVPMAKEDGEWKLAGATTIDQFHPDDPIPGGLKTDDLEG